MTSPACTALLTEHLRCTPLTIIDDIINTTNELLYLSVTAVESYLLKSAPSTLGFHPPPGTIRDTNSDGSESYSEAEAEEIEKGVHALETLLESAVDRSFDKFEIYVLRNILTVPEDLVPWVRLAHHKNLDFKTLPAPLPAAPDATSPENTTAAAAAQPAQEAQTRLRTLRQTLLASHALNQTLRKEVSSNEQTLAQLRLLVSASSAPSSGTENPFAFLTSPTPLAPATKDAAAFAVSQVDLIRQLVGTLRPKYEAFRAAQEAGVKERDVEMVDAEGDGGVLTAEEERKRYIERMTRRHMEASRGLRLNAKGEVVGGESEGAAARKGLGEVEGLEAVLGRE